MAVRILTNKINNLLQYLHREFTNETKTHEHKIESEFYFQIGHNSIDYRVCRSSVVYVNVGYLLKLFIQHEVITNGFY